MESSTPVFDASATKDIPKSRLLALPLELKIKIYKELLYPGPFLEDILCTGNKDRPGKEHEVEEGGDRKADCNEAIVHSKNAEGGDEEAAEASEQHEVEVETEDEHGDDDHGEVKADGTDLDEEDQSSEESTANIEKGDYGRIDYGTTPPDYGFGWLQPSNSCGIDPSLLSVNRQIHDEGITFLYKNVSCHFRFSQDLRSWSIQRFLMQEYRRSYAIDEDNSSSHMHCAILCTRHYNSRSGNQSGLNLHCLRWVSDINIDIAWDDILGPHARGWKGIYQQDRELDFTPEGELVLDILRYLIQTSAPSISARGRLHITLNGVRWGSFAASFEHAKASAWSQRSRLMDTRKKEGIAQMISLLRSLRRLWDVTVRDGLWMYENNRGEMLYVSREVDLDSLAWVKT